MIVLPLMLAELVLGRRGRSDAIRSILKVAEASNASARWGLVGGLGIATGFLILSFYSVTTVSAIVARGIAGGIEEASKMLMPVLVTLLAGLAVYSAIEGDLVGALRFLFVFDAARMTPQGALEALGLGFFSIGVGLCIMITYAAYAGTHVDLGEVA